MADALEEAHPGLAVELVVLKTTGDRVQDKALAEVGGKGLFTKELEIALLNREIDFAVHSLKDVPVTMPLVDQTDLMIASVPLREDPSDVLVGRELYASLDSLPKDAKVGTCSMRRAAQIRERRPDVRIEIIRGNIDTRIHKVQSGEFDATILAHAGLKRSGLFDLSFMSILSLSEMLPAAGQGALALQCRRDATDVQHLLDRLNDPSSARCVAIEREIIRLLDGDCHSPIAVLAHPADGQAIHVELSVAQSGGFPPIQKASMTFSDQDFAEKCTTIVQMIKR